VACVPTGAAVISTVARVRSERGQASVEWVGLVLLVSLALGAAVAVAPAVDGRSLGGFLAHQLVCVVRGGCPDGDARLAAAYGARDAALVREHAPNLVYEPGERQLPVDYRRCRSRACADGPDDREADVHRTNAGHRATVFTRVIRRGGRLYIQYWLYYPDSNTTWAASDKVWERSTLLPLVGKLARGEYGYPGFHDDDWEGYAVRIDPDGKVWARATSHGHWQGCKQSSCRGEWIGATGWTRVTRGSHAGHLPVDVSWPGPNHPRDYRTPRRRRERPRYPGRDMRERTTTADGLRLIPLEPLDPRTYKPIDDDVKPPWRKDAYRDPESDGS
jgi:hypothetical protein